jgi:hypothetical protein
MLRRLPLAAHQVDDRRGERHHERGQPGPDGEREPEGPGAEAARRPPLAATGV